MRMPEWPLWRIFRPISSAVICSTMRAFSSLPPSMARTPGIFAASVLTVFRRLGRRCRQSHRSQPTSSLFNTSAEVLWNAATTETPWGTSSAACCAAEPSHTPRVRVARPPTLAARGTVVSTHDASGTDCGLDLLQQGLALKRDCEDEQIGCGAGGNVVFARNLSRCRQALLDFRGRVVCAAWRPAIR